MNVDVDVDGLVSYGFALEGKIVPPKIDDVGYYAYASSLSFSLVYLLYPSRAFTGKAAALWHITTTAEVEVLTKRLEVVNIPLSPLSIPG